MVPPFAVAARGCAVRLGARYIQRSGWPTRTRFSKFTA
jgi:hypothetical protein